MSQLSSTLAPSPSPKNQIITPIPYPSSSSPQLSSLTIGIIVISVVVGVGLLGLSFLLLRRHRRKSSSSELVVVDIESPHSNSKKKRRNKRRVSSLSSQEENNIPVQTSSLDNNNDLFNTILEYPAPTKPASLPAQWQQLLLQVPTTLKKQGDPISASLARQSIEERSGYYKSPTRTPIPYYQHQSCSSAASLKTHKKTLGEDDENEKAMQRWSASYQVW